MNFNLFLAILVFEESLILFAIAIEYLINP